MFELLGTTDVVRSSLLTLWAGVIGYAPQLIAALFILLLGWLVAALLGRLAYHIVRALHVDEALKRVGFKEAWEKSGLKLDSGMFFAELVKWFFLIVFLMAVTNILGLDQVSAFLQTVVLYLPNVIVAAVILLIGILVAKFLESAVRASVRAAGLAAANFLATLTKWSVLVFSFLVALSQLEVAEDIIRIVIIGLVAAGSLAGGLAFGLGGTKHADELLSALRKKLQD